MNYYVFQASDRGRKTAQEFFASLVKERNVWGFGQRTPYRVAIQPGDRVLFYLTGVGNQVFVGAAVLKSGAYEDTSGVSREWYDDSETLRIDLQDVVVFPEPRPRQGFQSLEWRPSMGGASRISERDFMVVLGAQADVAPREVATDGSMEFALERYLEDFMIENWGHIDFGEHLTLHKDEDGNSGQQYYTGDAGYIDILTRDASGGFVVIELKKGRKNDEVVGQVLRYIGWVRQNLATHGEAVRGLIIVRERDPRLEYAVSELAGRVVAKRYAIDFKLLPY